MLRKLAGRVVPESLKRMLSPGRGPAVGRVRFGDLRRRDPFSRTWGEDRGQPIDRYYIEEYLTSRAADVKGRVLDIGEDSYTRRFGGEKVTRIDILHAVEGNPKATFVGDLADAPQIPDNAFDCILLCQTLQLIYDLRGAIRTCHRILKPGGVVIATVPGITHICHRDVDSWGSWWHWSLTKLSARKLFEDSFGAGNVSIENRGNVFSATAFLYGLSVQDVAKADLDFHDEDYQVNIGVRAVKEGA